MHDRLTFAPLLAALLALSACAERPAPSAPPAAAAAGERFVLRESVVADLKPVAGVVTTRDMGEARARIGGTLVNLAVKEGDTVAKGQVIARVADQRLAFETSAYASQVAAAAAEAERAAAELVRIRTLYEKGVYAKARLEQAEAAARGAQGQLDAARAQRAASAELSAQGAVLAPSAGRVLRAETPAGSVVAPGQSIATITSGAPILRVEVPEASGRALRVGDRVSVSSAGLRGAAESGVVAQVYPAVNAGRVVADITVAGLESDLVGQRVAVRVKVAERRALVVPRRFVVTRYGVDFVRVLGAGGRASDVAVQIAAGPDAASVEIMSGLSSGDVLLAPGAG